MTPTTLRTLPLVVALAMLVTASVAATSVQAGDEVRVTVLVILASSDPKATIAPELEDVAKELQKKDKTLRGFRLGTTTSKNVKVGGKEEFPLVDDQVVVVLVFRGLGDDEKIQLKIKPPGAKDAIYYSCCCGKYFPFMTGYYTKDKKERVIVAVMADPCRVKK